MLLCIRKKINKGGVNMWSQSVGSLNPYEALANASENAPKEDNEK